MKSVERIPVNKIQRSASIIKAGVKVGGNYLSYYGGKALNMPVDKEKLDKNNASDIYDSLKELKGSALKVAQMLSMEKSILPAAYSKEFSQAQYSAPPLSAPLIRNTFKKYMGQTPENFYDEFDARSYQAASIGQVHKAKKEGKNLAVKIQYPGVADSISSDLALVKPIALRLFKLNAKDSEKYFKEVEEKLLEEVQYELEVDRSIEITHACQHLPNMVFPTYYKDWSSDRIITMDWLDGIHISEFTKTNTDQELANKIGQSLWDFYMYQNHNLRMIHADPHPGNFLITPDGKLGVIDFGCIKEIPEEFYEPYFELTELACLNDQMRFVKNISKLEILREDDSEEEKEFFTGMFHDMLSTLGLPLRAEKHDFSDKGYFDKLSGLGEKYRKLPEIKQYNMNRGSRHFLYMNRTIFGLYSILHDLGATINTNQHPELINA